ncbi:hypothetical protein VB548_21655 [Vibrio parahaemolyticus]|uniref:hypothetical protein n=1 Tax=Vibrio parahaemolyticus TaxID=670 RepID=UPI002B1F2CCD|nr:hypothetical protein [Vibrio parahaemolyticus]MEA5308896.1 hypothetical protein [Vibrio parahaemolyticus]
MMNKNRDLGYLLEELKIQMIRGRGPWLVGRVSLEYEGKVIVASGKALELMLEKTESILSMIHVRATIIAGQRRNPFLLYSKEYEKLFLIIVKENEECLALRDPLIISPKRNHV